MLRCARTPHVSNFPNWKFFPALESNSAWCSRAWARRKTEAVVAFLNHLALVHHGDASQTCAADAQIVGDWNQHGEVEALAYVVDSVEHCACTDTSSAERLIGHEDFRVHRSARAMQMR